MTGTTSPTTTTTTTTESSPTTTGTLATAATRTAGTAALPGGPLYRLRGVGKTYATPQRTVQALKDVDLEVWHSDFIAVQGPTGGGKSTMLQLLGALDVPTAGTVELDGTDMGQMSSSGLTTLRARKIGFVFQGFNLIPTLTAAENVETGLVPLGIDRAERQRRVDEALSQVGLLDRAKHLPGELSGGQQQRVAIARAIVKRPTVLLADEPTGNLDEHTRDEIMALLEGLNDDGLTLVVVTHDSAVAARAGRRLRLAAGSVSEQRPARR